MIVNRDIITSRQNEAISGAFRLREKKHRDRERLFLIDGKKLFLEAVASDAPIETIFIKASEAEQLAPLVDKAVENKIQYEKTRVNMLSEPAFDKISAEKSPEGIICTVKYLDIFHKYTTIDNDYVRELSSDESIMMLYSVRDPGNIGTIVRSAAALGTDRLLLSSDCADIYNQRAVRAAMGALFKQVIHIVDDFVASVSTLALSGRRVLAAEPKSDGLSLDKFKMLRSDCIIIGNEANGIPLDITSLCSGSIYIPIQRKSESLNAAVAASVLMWEQSKIL